MATFGVLISNRSFFPDHLVLTARAQLLASLEAWGHRVITLSTEDTHMGETMTYDEAVKCAALFRAHSEEIDGVIIALPNFGEEAGIADAMRMSRLDCPILIQASDDDFDKLQLENRRDAFCGKLSLCNNLYQYGIKYTLTRRHTCAILSDEFRADVDFFARVCRVVKALKTARIGQIGARVAPFRTVRYSEKLLQASGITVETEDFSEILADANQMNDRARMRRQGGGDPRLRQCGALRHAGKMEKQAKLNPRRGGLDGRAPLHRQRHSVLGQRGGQLRLRDVPGHEHDGRNGPPQRLRDRRDGRAFDAGASLRLRRPADLPGLEQQL
jgi:hypothetical protein